ncbi:MAG TPA: hypothetical protein PLI51_02280 [bacterium]|nr:hypothetical protein [bacterium]HPQ65542.1 hypothetical protein [bacterium]
MATTPLEQGVPAAGAGNSRPAVAVAVLAFLCFAWPVYNWPGFWNTNEYSRVFLTRALVDRGSLSIDREVKAHFTQDISYFRGRFYSNKAPGISFLAALPYLGIRAVETAAGRVAAEPLLLYLLRLSTVSLPAALFLLVLNSVWRRMGAPAPLRLALLAVSAAGTPALAYSMLLYSHYPAGMLLFSSWALLERGRAPAGAGFLAGLAVVVEYPAAVPALLLWLYSLRGGRSVRRALVFALGLGVPLAGLMLYQRACFGGVFSLPYLHETHRAFFLAHNRGIVGVTYPRLETVFGLTVSPFRGLLFYAPILAAAVPGLIVLAADPRRRADGWLFIGISLSYFYIASAFSDWEGGWSAGPRHLVPLIPFWLTAVVRLLARSRRRGAWALVLAPLGLISVIHSVSAAATFPYFPLVFSAPLYDLAPALMEKGLFAPSLGEAWGWRQWPGILPFVVLTGVMAGFYLGGLILWGLKSPVARSAAAVLSLVCAAVFWTGARNLATARAAALTGAEARAYREETARLERFMSADQSSGAPLTGPEE